MILDSYQKELNVMRMINSEHMFVTGVVSKIGRDHNIKSFLGSLISNCASFDSLEYMERYYFTKDLEEAYELFSALFAYMINSHHLKDVDSNQIVKPCYIYPDHTGRSAMRFIGYFVLIEVMHEKHKSLQLLESKSFSELDQNYVNNTLFNRKSLHFRKYPEDKFLIDAELQRKKVEFEREEYENNRKPLLEEAISRMCEALSNNDVIVAAGCKYWDAKLKKRKECVDEFSEALLAMVNAIDRDDDLK